MWKTRLVQIIVALLGVAFSFWYIFLTPQYVRTNALSCPHGQATCEQGLALAPFPMLVCLFALLLVLVSVVVWAIGSISKAMRNMDER